MSGIVKPGEAGVLELPGIKGTIQIHYDITRSMVQVEAKNIAHAQLIQLLLVGAQGVAAEWAAMEAGIIRPKGTTTDGSEEKKNDDENNG